MNRDRRKRLADIQNLIEGLKNDVEALRDEEQEAKDNMPESFQAGEQGEKADNAIQAMEDAIGKMDAIISDMDDLVGDLETAAEVSGYETNPAKLDDDKFLDPVLYFQLQVAELVRRAEQAGVILTVERVSLQPYAIRNTVPLIEARLKR